MPELTLRNWRIANRNTKQIIYKRAETPKDACEEMGWLLGECECREVEAEREK